MYEHETPQRGRRGRAALLTLVALAATLAACDGSPTEPAEQEVLLGGIFSLTGNWSTLGQTSEAAMEIAIADVNQFLARNPARLRFRALIEDTRLEPPLAVEKAEALRAQGVQVLIGPQSSAEVAALKAYVDTNEMILISQGSTAGTLAIPGDNVFRFTPSDALEGVAGAAMIWDDGIRALVPAWRSDPGNAGLATATSARITELGGTVLQGVEYATSVQDFAATVAALRTQVDQAIAQHGTSQVGVYLAAFDEAAELFESAVGDPVLGSVRWYGSDGVALSDALISSPQAVEFATRVGYPNPILGFEEGAREIWEPLATRIRARTGLDPDGFALGVYDAVWVIARAYIAAGASPEMDRLKQAFTAAAATHYGATGWAVLNEAGDRRYGDFDFWAIRRVDGEARWMRVAQYESRTGRLIR